MVVTGRVEALSIGPNGNVAHVKVAGFDARFTDFNFQTIYLPCHFAGRDLHLGEELTLELRLVQ